jgi:hypothetical protein
MQKTVSPDLWELVDTSHQEVGGEPHFAEHRPGKNQFVI